MGVTIDGVLVKIIKYVGDGTNNTTLAAAGSGGEFTLTLPSSAGSSGQYLKTDGSGNLSWDCFIWCHRFNYLLIQQ